MVVLALASPSLAQTNAAGLEPVSNAPEAFAAQLKQEIPRWQQVMKAANIYVE